MIKNKDNQEITEFTLINKIQKHLRELKDLRFQLFELIEEPSCFYSGRVDRRILNIVAEKFDFIDIIDVDGELFKVEKRDGYRGKKLTCKKILWDLTLSKNEFKIERIDEETSDGEYDYSHYEINEEIVNLD